MRWWQPLFIAAEIYLVACVLPWLAVAALSWSLQHSYRSRRAVLAYYDHLLQNGEFYRAFWAEQPRFGPYQSLSESADTQLALLASELAQASSLAEPLREAQLPSCTAREILTLRCWKAASEAYAQFQQVHHLALVLGEATDTLAALADLRQKIIDLPSDMHAQLALREYELSQLSARLDLERTAGTIGLEGFYSGAEALRSQLEKLRQELDAHGTEPAAIERVAESNAVLASGITRLGDDLSALEALRRSAEEALTHCEETLSYLQQRWRNIQRQHFREQEIDEVLLGLSSLCDELRARLAQRTRDAYRAVNAQAQAFHERTDLLQEDFSGLERSLAEADANLNSAADELNAAWAVVDDLQQRYAQVRADLCRALYDEAAADLASASDMRQQGSRSALVRCQEIADSVRSQATELIARAAALEERVQAVNALWAELNQGDITSYQNRCQFAEEKLQAYPRHLPAVEELLNNIALSQHEAELAISCLPADFTRDGVFVESQLDDIYEALQYAQHGVEYVRTGIDHLKELLEQIEAWRLQVEQQVAMLLYVDLPAVEQLSGSMLVELREKLVLVAIEIRQEAAKLLDPSQTEYDEALRFGLPYLKRQLEEVRAAHATHLKQLQLQYDDEKRQLTRSWAQLDRLDVSNLPVVQPLVLRIKAEYAEWQQTAEGNRENAYVLSQTLGRRSAELNQKMTDLYREIVEGRQALKELDKTFQQRYAQAQTLRDHLQSVSASSAWPNLTWDIDAVRAWGQVQELQRAIDKAATLPSLLDAWQRTLGACTELVRLYERGVAQSRDGLNTLQNEFKAVNALKQRAQHQAEELVRQGEHGASRKLTKMAAQVEHLIELSQNETVFDNALRYLREAKDKLLRL